MRSEIAIVLVLLILSACSVSEPRHGFSNAAVAGADRELSASTRSDDDALLSPGSSSVTGTEGGRTPGAPRSGTPSASTGQRAATPGASASGSSPSSGSPAVGVTSNSITISYVAGFSGAFGPVNDQVYDGGFAVWVDDVNARGGLHGRKVIVKKVDHRESTEGGVAACKEIQSNGSFMAVIPEGTDGSIAAVACLDKAGIQTLSNAVDVDPAWRRAFLYIPTSEGWGVSTASFVKGVMNGGNHKIGVIHLNDAGATKINQVLVAEAKRNGLQVVKVEAVEPNQSSFVPQLGRLRDAGSDLVVLIVSIEQQGILRDSKAMGYAPAFVVARTAFDLFAKASRDLESGVKGTRAWTTVGSAAYNAYKAKQSQTGRSPATNEADAEMMLTYGVGLLSEEVLTKAGQSPTQESLFAGTTSITDYNNGILTPITWRADRLAGTRAVFPVVCCDSNWSWKPLGPPAAAF